MDDPAKVSVVASALTPVSVPDTPPNTSKVVTPSAVQPVVSMPAASTQGREPSVTRVSPEMMASLLRRGDAMLRQGDVLSARLFFERAAAEVADLSGTNVANDPKQHREDDAVLSGLAPSHR